MQPEPPNPAPAPGSEQQKNRLRSRSKSGGSRRLRNTVMDPEIFPGSGDICSGSGKNKRENKKNTVFMILGLWILDCYFSVEL